MTVEGLPHGVSSHVVDTARIRTHYCAAGPEDGTPVVFVHGNIVTGVYFDEILAALPDGWRGLAPTLRGFGDSEPAAIDATRGMRDFSDDVVAFLDAVGVDEPAHLVGWSTGGGVIMQLAIDHPDRVASLTLEGTVSPYGFGGTRGLDGEPCYPDYAGSGAGTAPAEFVQRIRDGDRSSDGDLAPRNVMVTSFWSPDFTLDQERAERYLTEVLKSETGDGNYPGDATTSENWPGIAPGTSGVNNALSGKYLNVSGIVDLDRKPPVLWIRGANDIVCSDTSAWDIGYLGQLGVVPDWPGDEVFPPQPMVGQTRAVLDRYAAAGGSYREEVLEGSGHGPHVDNAERFQELLFGFLAEHR